MQMTNYKVQFIDKKNQPIKSEILVIASSKKAAIREACRIGGLEYPSKNKAEVSEINLSKTPPPVKKVEPKSSPPPK